MSEYDDEEWPTAAGSVFGIRGWALRLDPVWLSRTAEDGESLTYLLQGNHRTRWYNSVLTAECTPLIACRREHTSPDSCCACGIYALWNKDALLDNHYFTVFGIIEGSGKTLIGSRGFRCQYAKIVALSKGNLSAGIWDAFANTLREIYRVPIYSNDTEILENHPTTQDYAERLEDVGESI